MKRVAKFKFLGHPMDQKYDNCLMVHQNVKRAWKVWEVLVNMIQR